MFLRVFAVCVVIVGTIELCSCAPTLFGRQPGFTPYYGPGAGSGFGPPASFRNFRVRRQSSPFGGFQSSGVRLNRFSGFDAWSGRSGPSGWNPFVMGGRRSPPVFRGMPRMSEFARSSPSGLLQSNPSSLLQSGRTVRTSRRTPTIRSPSFSPALSSAMSPIRGGLRSFGTTIARQPRFGSMPISRGSIGRQVPRGITGSRGIPGIRGLTGGRDFTGTGTRDDPIRIRAAPLPVGRRIRQSSRATGISAGRAQGSSDDSGIIALFGFEDPVTGGSLELSETVDKTPTVQRTPIKKSETAASKTQTTGTAKAEQTTLQKLEQIVRESANSVISAKKDGHKVIDAAEKVVAAKTVSEIPVEAVVAEIPAEVISEVPTETIISETPTEVIEHVPSEVIAEVPVDAIVSEIPAEIVSEVSAEGVVSVPTEVVAEIPVEMVSPEAGVIEVPVEAVADVPVEVSGSVAAVDTTITDADTVNVNINSDVTAHVTGSAEPQVATETASAVTDAGTTLHVEPLTSGVEAAAILGEATPISSDVVVDKVVVVEPSVAEVGGAIVEGEVSVHDVGGVSVVGEASVHDMGGVSDVGGVSVIADSSLPQQLESKHSIPVNIEVTNDLNTNNVNTNEANAL